MPSFDEFLYNMMSSKCVSFSKREPRIRSTEKFEGGDTREETNK
jgi:hypothetical protein